MLHPLCLECLHTCKQDEGVDIVKCANFQKRVTDGEFRDLIGELDDMEAKADEIKARTRNLIEMARQGGEPRPGDDGGGDGEEDLEDDGEE